MKSEVKIFFASDEQRLNEVKAYIDQHLQDDLRLDQLAQRFGSSRSKLKRQFKHQYQLSIGPYILQKRMQHARILILERTMAIGEIAITVGYKKRTSFTHAFTSFFGCSPLDLLTRQMKAENDPN